MPRVAETYEYRYKACVYEISKSHSRELVMKVYARLALALLSCGTALLLATGGAVAHTAKHASTAAQTEAAADAAADTVVDEAGDTAEATEEAPAVAPASDEENTEDDTDEEGPDEDGQVENRVPDHQPAGGAPGSHHDEGVAERAEASGVNQAEAGGETQD
jgi:hypothetical protein